MGSGAGLLVGVAVAGACVLGVVVMEKYNVENLALELIKYLHYDLDFVILCLGSSNCIGDCLGCVVGSLLKNKYNIPNYCYGDLENNINKSNLETFVSLISHRHAGKKVLVIDSAVGTRANNGVIRVRYGGIVPRSALEDNAFNVVGDVAICGLVCSADAMKKELLLADHKYILDMAKTIALAICEYRKLVKSLMLGRNA